MRAPGLEQLRQRVIAAYHLGPLTEREIAAYVRHRLKVVGWQDDPALEEGIFEKIYHATGGVPRRINTFFDRLLLNAYLDEMHAISVKAVEAVAAEVEQEIRGPEGSPEEGGVYTVRVQPAASAAPAESEATIAMAQRLERVERQLIALTTQLAQVNRPLPVAQQTPVEPDKRDNSRWTFAFLALSVCVAVGLGIAGYLVLR
jgi:general secretion pathway protein A